MPSVADDLARAIERTKAVRLSESRFAIPELTRLGGWHTTSEEGVIRSAFDEDAPDALYVEMPSWWSPERRYAVIAAQRSGGGVTVPVVSKETALAAGVGALVVTANIETGEEVLA